MLKQALNDALAILDGNLTMRAGVLVEAGDKIIGNLDFD